MLRIALLQLKPTGSLAGNLEKGIEMCRKASASSADIALFPEMWSNGYDIVSRPYAEWKNDAISKDSHFVKSFQLLAEELGMAIAVTLLEKGDKGPRNSLIIFDRHGNMKLHYSKIHTCDFSSERYLEQGDDFHVTALDTATDSIRIGAMICYDREFPESARILMLKGAEVILVPNACPMEINRLSQLRSRAFENMTAIATCNYPEGVPDCNGRSSVFDGVAYLPGNPESRDTCILEADGEEDIFIADIDMDMLRNYRKSEVHGNAYRHPGKYALIIDNTIAEPFIRSDHRKQEEPYASCRASSETPS